MAWAESLTRPAMTWSAVPAPNRLSTVSWSVRPLVCSSRWRSVTGRHGARICGVGPTLHKLQRRNVRNDLAGRAERHGAVGIEQRCVVVDAVAEPLAAGRVAI
ncbi:uncharacterized protein SPSK_08118 [Sporothrix schenckii 1099-18]|uniref:Uncharacterized protein n=1 Tax=Sporothrix schenckii 1099-18 TaxID=1397361 RepID=A0A0F2MH10_SPOSC|nr:uncharacterized protein SPSK_08118 [Sporothrix schenckii 1099-18]KJR88140.1 hypothetical protein SPSK_08118 [Sporothrix schenckii 1099-18]